MKNKRPAILVDTPNGKKGKVYCDDLHLEKVPTYILDEKFNKTGEKRLYHSSKLIVAGRFD